VDELCVQLADRRSYGFEEAAIESLRQCRYEPATLDGEPVRSKFETWVVFELY